MTNIVPAILPGSRDELAQKLAQLSGITESVQVDLVDGDFASPATWPYLGGEKEPPSILDSFLYEVDLMVHDIEPAIHRWLNAGATRVTIHVAAAHGLPALLEMLRTRYGHDKHFTPGLISIGLALGIDTDVSLIEPYLDDCDYVQFMGIASIGKQGQPFDERVVPRVHAFHRAHPEMPIQVDGGVSLETAPKLLAAGASRLVIGSAFWKAPDLAARLSEFEELVQLYGTYS